MDLTDRIKFVQIIVGSSNMVLCMRHFKEYFVSDKAAIKCSKMFLLLPDTMIMNSIWNNLCQALCLRTFVCLKASVLTY